jgi:hypothetical protein
MIKEPEDIRRCERWGVEARGKKYNDAMFVSVPNLLLPYSVWEWLDELGLTSDHYNVEEQAEIIIRDAFRAANPRKHIVGSKRK